MKVYRISRAKLEELRPSLVRRSAVVMTIMIGATLFISFRELGRETGVFTVLTILFLGGTFTLAIFRGAAKARALTEEMVTTFELLLDSDRLIRRQRNLPEITMNYSDIRRIQENRSSGLSIVGTSGREAIGITSAVENYEQLKVDLVLLTGVEFTQASGPPAHAWTYLAVLVVLGLGGVSFLVPNRFVASGASFVLSTVMLAATVLIRRNPNIPRELKGRLLLVLIPAIVLIARGVLLLRSH